MIINSVADWIRAYAEHIGFIIPTPDLAKEIRRRLSHMTWWTPYYIAAGAVAARWIFPLLIVHKPNRFDNLSNSEKEYMLEYLQNTEILILKGAYFGVKTLALSCCYGRPQYLKKIGYEMRDST